MNKNIIQWTFPVVAATLFISTNLDAAVVAEAQYCIEQGGTVETMVAELQSGGSLQRGFTQDFCTFSKNGGFIAVGLSTFASKQPNIAASFIKTLPAIDRNSPLWQGKYANPGTNVCKNLGGANIGFNVPTGGFKNKLGQSDICVFGDGSMVSSWSLIYMANGRPEYDTVKNAVQAQPLHVSY